jgi:hypothetical protein
MLQACTDCRGDPGVCNVRRIVLLKTRGWGGNGDYQGAGLEDHDEDDPIDISRPLPTHVRVCVFLRCLGGDYLQKSQMWPTRSVRECEHSKK